MMENDGLFSLLELLIMVNVFDRTIERLATTCKFFSNEVSTFQLNGKCYFSE